MRNINWKEPIISKFLLRLQLEVEISDHKINTSIMIPIMRDDHLIQIEDRFEVSLIHLDPNQLSYLSLFEIFISHISLSLLLSLSHPLSFPILSLSLFSPFLSSPTISYPSLSIFDRFSLGSLTPSNYFQVSIFPLLYFQLSLSLSLSS